MANTFSFQRVMVRCVYGDDMFFLELFDTHLSHDTIENADRRGSIKNLRSSALICVLKNIKKPAQQRATLLSKKVGINMQTKFSIG
jgi:hypothetical protein